MELVVRKNDLLKELSLLQGIVERKNTIPILANVLIDASKDGISLLATDLDVGLRSRCDGIVTKPGVLTLPAKKLFEIVKEIENGLTYKDIAAKLGISPHTVHTHIKNIYEKLHAKDRPEALVAARRKGII